MRGAPKLACFEFGDEVHEEVIAKERLKRAIGVLFDPVTLKIRRTKVVYEACKYREAMG